MSKVKVLALVIVSIMFCSGLAFAQAPLEKNPPVVEEKTPEKQMDKGQMGGMIMQMMGGMQKQMLATSDGGVIVMTANKLSKYDKDLNLVKEVELKTPVELKMDTGPIQEMMKNMKEKYGKKNKVTQEDSQETENK